MKKSTAAQATTRPVSTKETSTAVSTQNKPEVLKPFTKADTLAHIADKLSVSRKTVAAVLEQLQDIIEAHVQGAVPFSMPGLLKVCVVSKPATKERKGTNPFTREPTVYKAKPAHKVVKIKPLKKLKSLVESKTAES